MARDLACRSRLATPKQCSITLWSNRRIGGPEPLSSNDDVRTGVTRFALVADLERFATETLDSGV
eukprot:scaffold267594_cov39-Tisochrysis_lutea.AAC.1